MRELIPIEQRESGKQLVDARMLHGFLEAETRFNDWINRRISTFGFIEDEDYIIHYSKMSNESTNNLRAPIDYGLTLDMAKQLCMVENNEKGIEARRYFIECEKIAKSNVPRLGTRSEILKQLQIATSMAIEAEEQRLLLSSKNEELTHALANTAEEKQSLQNITKPHGYIRIGDAAKIINHPDLGPNRMFKFLCDQKVLKKVDREDKRYTYYHQYSHHFKMITTRQNGGHQDRAYYQVLINIKGVIQLHRKILNVLGPWDGMSTKEELMAQFTEMESK